MAEGTVHQAISQYAVSSITLCSIYTLSCRINILCHIISVIIWLRLICERCLDKYINPNWDIICASISISLLPNIYVFLVLKKKKEANSNISRIWSSKIMERLDSYLIYNQPNVITNITLNSILFSIFVFQVMWKWYLIPNYFVIKF